MFWHAASAQHCACSPALVSPKGVILCVACFPSAAEKLPVKLALPYEPSLITVALSCCREYRDVTSNTGLPTSTAYPTRDENGHILTTEFGMCVYKNHQVITIQVGRPKTWSPCFKAAIFLESMA